jgi:hypothetical protein
MSVQFSLLVFFCLSWRTLRGREASVYTHPQSTTMRKVGPGLFLRSVVVPTVSEAEGSEKEPGGAEGGCAQAQQTEVLEERELVRHGITHRLLVVVRRAAEPLHVLDPAAVVPPTPFHCIFWPDKNPPTFGPSVNRTPFLVLIYCFFGGFFMSLVKSKRSELVLRGVAMFRRVSGCRASGSRCDAR